MCVWFWAGLCSVRALGGFSMRPVLDPQARATPEPGHPGRCSQSGAHDGKLSCAEVFEEVLLNKTPFSGSHLRLY